MPVSKILTLYLLKVLFTTDNKFLAIDYEDALYGSFYEENFLKTCCVGSI